MKCIPVWRISSTTGTIWTTISARSSKSNELLRAFQALEKARQGDLSAPGFLGNQVYEVLNVGAGNQGGNPYKYYMLYYDAACIHAALAKRAILDHGRPSIERERLADQDLEPLQLLDKARRGR